TSRLSRKRFPAVLKKCLVCPNEFRVSPRRKETARYCSKSCSNTNLRKPGYGLPNAERKRIKLEALAGRKKSEHCELCGLERKLCFDHDHTTGQFRGWL